MTTVNLQSSGKWYNKTWLVILLLILFFPVGLYGLWKSNKIAKGWKFAGTAIIVLLFIIGATADTPKSQTTSNAPTAKTPQADNKQSTSETVEQSSANDNIEEHLFETTDDFKNSWNNFCVDNGLHYRIGDIPIVEGKVNNTFTLKMNDFVSIVGSVDKESESVKELTLVGAGDGSSQSGLDILTGIGTLIGSSCPALNETERGDIIKSLGILDRDVDFKKLEKKYDYKNFHFWITANEYTGIMFGISLK